MRTIAYDKDAMMCLDPRFIMWLVYPMLSLDSSKFTEEDELAYDVRINYVDRRLTKESKEQFAVFLSDEHHPVHVVFEMLYSKTTVQNDALRVSAWMNHDHGKIERTYEDLINNVVKEAPADLARIVYTLINYVYNEVTHNV